MAAVAPMFAVVNVVAKEDGNDGRVNEDGMEVLVAEVEVAFVVVVVQAVKQIERWILHCEDTLRLIHLDHLCFDFWSMLTPHDDDEPLLPIVVGYHAKVLFVMLRCSIYVQLGCAA